MRARVTLVISLGTLILASSCKKLGTESASADSTFVHTMVALRLVTSNTALDSATQARARDSILRHYGTSAADLEATAHLIAKNPDHAVELLRKIDNSVRLAPRQVTPPPPAPTH
jgi:hypothetical protein